MPAEFLRDDPTFVFRNLPVRLAIAERSVGLPASIGDLLYLSGMQSEVQTITITGSPTGGTFTITFAGQTTAPIAYNAAAAAVQTALQALGAIGAGNVTVSGSAGGPYTATFAGVLAEVNVPQMSATGSFTGGSSPAVAVATTTQGIGLADLKTGWSEIGGTEDGVDVSDDLTIEEDGYDQRPRAFSDPNGLVKTISGNATEHRMEVLKRLRHGTSAITTNTSVTPNERRIDITDPKTLPAIRLALIVQKNTDGLYLARIFPNALLTGGGSTGYGPGKSLIPFEYTAKPNTDLVDKRLEYILEQGGVQAA